MILFFLLLILNLILFFNLKRISRTLNIYDSPDNKLKLHKSKIPITGGLILVINFSITFFYQIIFLEKFFVFDLDSLQNNELFSLLILIYGYFFLGLYDDKFHLNPLKRISFSVLIILVAILLNKDLLINNFTLTFFEKRIFFENFSLIFTIFCILILVNSLNFYDGINGQSCLIFLVFFTYLSIISGFNFFYLICVMLIFFNNVTQLKNMLFLGDGGVYLLGIILSASLIYEHNVKNNIIYADEIFFLLLLPGFDLVRLTITRSFNLKNPFMGDRNHIHHLLINKFSLIFSNSILFFLSILPIFLINFLKLNFFLIFIIFFITYFFLILFLKSSDKINNDKNKKILVVGAGGFIGGHLVKKLLEYKNSLIVVDIKPKEYWFQDYENAINYYSMNMKEINNCREVTKNIDYVFNMACNMGGMGFIENNKAECMQSVLINTNLLIACKENGIKKYFFSWCLRIQ